MARKRAKTVNQKHIKEVIVKPEDATVKLKAYVEIYYCYASKDERFLDELEKHLAPLKQSSLKGSRALISWHQGKVQPGSEREQEIHKHLSIADILLFLISPDLLQSSDIYTEIEYALTRQKNHETRVIPILLRPANWQDTSLKDLQPLPKNGKPVTLWERKRDSAFQEIAEGIQEVVENLVKKQDFIGDDTGTYCCCPVCANDEYLKVLTMRTGEYVLQCGFCGSYWVLSRMGREKLIENGGTDGDTFVSPSPF